MKSGGGNAATHNALVPWSLGGTTLIWLLTRNVTSIVDFDGFSCALKLAMPLSVLSAMREMTSI
ncbi:MAG: hypothetical protein ACLRMW_06275 [[Clostridium] symbiosum]